MYGPVHGALSEGELGPRLQQQRQGSGVVSCADIKARNCGAMLLPLQAALCVSLLPLFPLARRGLGAPAACPPGRRGRRARLAPRHYAPQGATPQDEFSQGMLMKNEKRTLKT